MSDVNAFIDAIGKDVNAALARELRTLRAAARKPRGA